MRRLFCIVAMLLSFNVFAGNNVGAVSAAGWDKLSASQQAEVMKIVADKAEATNALPGIDSASDPKKVDEWISVGERIGKMMGGAAKEVGIAVNDFVNTPVGKMTMFLIVWKYMGAMAIHFFGGVLVMLVGAVVMTALYRRLVAVDITYDAEAKNIFGNHPKLKVERGAFGSDDFWAIFLGSASFTAASIICIFSF